MSDQKAERDRRLAEALRTNLRKRKAQDKTPPVEGQLVPHEDERAPH